MEKTWTVVRFEEENVVEAVPTSWIVNNRCYWPPYTTEKTLKCIKDHVDFDSSWKNFEVYVFKNSTSDNYSTCRLKAKKAEDTSDLNSDNNNKRKIKKNRIYDNDSNSESDSESDHTMLPSPPSLQEKYSDTKLQGTQNKKPRKENTYIEETHISKYMRCNDSFNSNKPRTSNLTEINRNKDNYRTPVHKSVTEKGYISSEEGCDDSLNSNILRTSNLTDINRNKESHRTPKSVIAKRNISYEERYDDSLNSNILRTSNAKAIYHSKDDRRTSVQTFITGKENTYAEKCNTVLSNDDLPGTSTNVCSSNIQHQYSQKDMDVHRERYSTTVDNAQMCTCCPIHKNYDEKFRRIFKELFLSREMTKECCEELKVIFIQNRDINKIDENEPIFLNRFQFPLQNAEDLQEVEQYLQEPNHFQSTIIELSRIGGTTPYDFIKRCLSLLLTNRFAEQYSWYGAKKKKIFGKLHLANVLLESAQRCKAAINRKEVEEAIKAWLRRAKERMEKENK